MSYMRHEHQIRLHWVNISTGGLLVPESFIRPVVVSVLTWFNAYIYIYIIEILKSQWLMLFGYPIFWPWPYVMKVIPEIRRTHYIRYPRLFSSKFNFILQPVSLYFQTLALKYNSWNIYKPLKWSVNPYFVKHKNDFVNNITYIYKQWLLMHW